MTGASSCVLLAGRNPLLAEGIRGLLQPAFDAVVMVADHASLVESAVRLGPGLVILDLALGHGDLAGLIGRLRAASPSLKVLVLGMHDELCVAAATIRAGADAFVVTRDIATKLVPAVSALLARRAPEPGDPVLNLMVQE